MADQTIKVTIAAGTTAPGPYEIYYDSLSNQVTGSGGITQFTLAQLLAGYIVVVPTSATSIIVKNVNPACGNIQTWLFATPTNTPTSTPTSTPTQTPTNTFTATPTNTPTNTPTTTPDCGLAGNISLVPSATPTNTPSSTPTNTPTATPTNTDSGPQLFVYGRYINSGGDIQVSINGGPNLMFANTLTTNCEYLGEVTGINVGDTVTFSDSATRTIAAEEGFNAGCPTTGFGCSYPMTIINGPNYIYITIDGSNAC